jgi:non-specific serine/threonine protein kinase
LFLLDNCEHLIGAIANLAAELLQACPNVSVLATSREPLEIPGEIPFLINPLSIPNRNPWLSSENLIEYDGVRLFIERAQAILPGYKITAGNSSAIAEVCRRLDGLPLAIELAAARVKVLDVTELASRLSGSFRLLGHGNRTALPRSQTLEACIGWSYDLLSGEERLLFNRLSVFVGGWTLEAVENVCTDETIRPADVFDLLAQLVEKSLVVVVHWQDGTRYRFLETIHQYAHEKLISSGETPAFKDKHLDYFLRMVEKAKFEEHERVGFEVLNRIDADHDNLRAALEWSLANPVDSTLTVRLLRQLGRFWKDRGYLEEGRQRLSAFLARPEASAPTAERAELLCESAWLATYQSDIQAAKPLLEESLKIFRQLHPVGMRGEVDVLINLASIEIDGGDARIAVEHTQKALEFSERIDYPGGVSGAHHLMGVALGQLGDYEQAWKHFESSLLVDRTIGRPVHINLLQNMGELAVRKGEYEKGKAYLEESLQLAIEAKQKWDIGANLGTQGWAALCLGEFGQARQLLKESLQVRQEIGDQGGIAWCLEKLAEVAARQGGPGKAVLLLSQASSLRLAIGSQVNSADRPDYDRFLSSLRDRMEPAAFQAAWDMGADLLLDGAIDEALEEQISNYLTNLKKDKGM